MCREALAATASGGEFRERIAARRAEYDREMRRRSVPGLLLSDGTNPEALALGTPATDGTLVGMAAAPGTATGPPGWSSTPQAPTWNRARSSWPRRPTPAGHRCS